MDSYLGEIKIWPIGRVPTNWALCDGSLINISDNMALYSLIGTIYGGDGVQNFRLPDLRNRVPVHRGLGPTTNNGGAGTNRVLGQNGGDTTVTLTQAQLPVHEHHVLGTTADATTNTPGTGVVLATGTGGLNLYMKENAAGRDFSFNAQAVSNEGGSQPHANVMPSLPMNFIICTSGTYPTRP